VEAAEVENMTTGEVMTFKCDTILFSVGLIPENELLKAMGAKLDPATGGPGVDSSLQCTVPGVFAAGNSLHVHDLVDFASLEARRAGESAARYASGDALPAAELPVSCSRSLKYVVPGRCAAGQSCEFFFRPTVSCRRAKLSFLADGSEIAKKMCVSVRPAEMLAMKADVPAGAKKLSFELEECK